MKTDVRERDIEHYLVEQISKLGGKAYKFSSPNSRGVPDRLCILPNGFIFFVECKAPGRTVTPLQRLTIDKMRSMKVHVFITDSKSSVDYLINVVSRVKRGVQEDAQ